MTSLGGLSDRELVNRLRLLVKREQNLTLEIILHLVEVLRRRLHLGKGRSGPALLTFARGTARSSNTAKAN